MTLQSAWNEAREILLPRLRKNPDALLLACASLLGLVLTVPFTGGHRFTETLLVTHFVLWLVGLILIHRACPIGQSTSWRRVISVGALAVAVAVPAVLFALVSVSRGIPSINEAIQALDRGQSLLVTFAIAGPAVVIGRRTFLPEIERERPNQEMARRTEEALSVIFHELRRPLTLLVTSSELALDPETPEIDRRDLLQSVNRQALKLGLYLEELLECARIQASRLRISRRQLNVEALTHEVVDEFRDPQRNEITVTSPDANLFVAGDAARLKLVLRNLIANAIKYSPPAAPVAISIAGAPGKVAIHIDDEGPGIPEAYRNEIFEQFFRVPGSQSGGFGLGLYLSRQLVIAHGGKICVEARLVGGSRFSIYLPAVTPGGESAISRRASRSHPIPRS